MMSEDALPPDAFWQSTEEQELSVGGHGNYGDDSARQFIDWLLSEYQRWRPGDG